MTTKLNLVSSPSDTHSAWVGIPELLGGTDTLTSATVTTSEAVATIPQTTISTAQLTDIEGNVYEIGQAVTFELDVASASEFKLEIYVAWVSTGAQDGKTISKLTVQGYTPTSLQTSPTLILDPETDYLYVDAENGLDSNAGTVTAPFKTLSRQNCCDRPQSD